jgi:hypothetical protein
MWQLPLVSRVRAIIFTTTAWLAESWTRTDVMRVKASCRRELIPQTADRGTASDFVSPAHTFIRPMVECAQPKEVTMLNTVRLAFIGALMVLPQTTFAADKAVNACVDIAVPKDAVMARHGNWMELTPEQWQFLRGVYVLDPATPPGLPYGDKAVLAQIDGRPGGLVLFIDGDKACTPMLIPDELLSVMHDVATGRINHQGTGS